MAKVSKQSHIISELCCKLEQILCYPVATQKRVSLLKVWIFPEVSCVLYKKDPLADINIFRFFFKQVKIKAWKARKFPKNPLKIM